ncbi:sulfotransferase [uncultured Nocardioides sp.]|uniref:sulfotransferase family protein n=2 Tax=uncultured Nocardioides sp. TaxID=198441 RepID=UPI0026112487|nr:sulfotransferase [uncultured Nocardioides sp.]
MSVLTFDVDGLLTDAIRKEGVEDFGGPGFREPLGVLCAAYEAAPLSEVGRWILRAGLVHSLRMRLRVHEWVRRHPEIREERVEDPIVVVGMMRSGTTLVQRLLAADPALCAAAGWEVLEAAPPLDSDPADPTARIDRGLVREAQTREHAPELFAIHPMHALEAEEEIVFLADAFLSHVPESGAHVPGYRTWLDTQDLAPAYDHLHLVLQLLQWQKRLRGEPAARWVLKTPAHLGYLDTLRARFPGLHLVHLHRDPQDTIPSGASLNTVLHRMHSDDVDPERVGRDWLERMGWTHDRALDTRTRWVEDPAAPRVTDIAFREVVADPWPQVARVYADLGAELTGEAESSMRAWLDRRPPDPRRPAYAPEDFGLSRGLIAERFARENPFCQY